jgi:hypothetical protein
MMKRFPLFLFSILLSLSGFGQDCKVLLSFISMEYTGECKNGLANANGTAKGIHQYSGTFKDGMPNGKGSYQFSDSNYYIGNFQNGVLEGKGEMHFIRSSGEDSVVKGYWSAGLFRGKNYITYSTDLSNKFDQVEIYPSNSIGNRLTIEISSTTGTPNVALRSSMLTGNIISLTELDCPEGNNQIRFISNYKSGIKSTWTYELLKFPISLRGATSNGRIFKIEFYKASNWTVRLYSNQ